jgi:hypothetical protein
LVVKDRNALATMQTTMALFNNLTNYTMTKFEDLTTHLQYVHVELGKIDIV